MTRRRRRPKNSTPRAGEIRRSQMIGTYGPGSLVDLKDHAVVIGGLSFWKYPHGQDPVLQEPRLQQLLNERLTQLQPPVRLSSSAPFREPPRAEDRRHEETNGVQVLEFPRWFVCQNPDCRALVGREGLQTKRGRYVHDCRIGKKSWPMVPVRFVAACSRGHLEEFPWGFFVHAGADDRCPAHSLRLDEGVSGELAAILVRCTTCGRSRSLSRTGVAELSPPCRGERPWLGGREASEACGQRLRLLARSASNAYFAQVVSALSIPEPGRALEEAIEPFLEDLIDLDVTDLPSVRKSRRMGPALADFSDKEVMEVLESQRAGRPLTKPLRTAELLQFRAQPMERPGEIAPPAASFYARSFVPPEGLPDGVSRLVLAHRLREVRAQVGFTRLEPVTPNLQGEFDLGVQSQRLGDETVDWLPATEVLGEGVLLELDEDTLKRWEDRPSVQQREAVLRAGFYAWRERLSAPGTLDFPGIRYYLLHSLAHVLNTAISIHCGYPSAAIRERIYSAGRDAEVPMAAVLLSTGSSGLDGTLGGLVDEGRRIHEHLGRALGEARLCSTDPGCASHTPRDDHAERFLEGAACHACLYIPEPSCERFNTMLDRTLLVQPSFGAAVSDLAYFEAHLDPSAKP